LSDFALPGALAQAASPRKLTWQPVVDMVVGGIAATLVVLYLAAAGADLPATAAAFYTVGLSLGFALVGQSKSFAAMIANYAFAGVATTALILLSATEIDGLTASVVVIVGSLATSLEAFTQSLMRRLEDAARPPPSRDRRIERD